MSKNLKNSIGFIIIFVITLVIIDLFFQNSKIITSLSFNNPHSEKQYGRSNFDSFYFNEGFGIQYTNEQGIVNYNEGKEVHWNLYGDSFIEAQQIFQRHHFANYLAVNKNVSIRNFGQSSMNLEGMFSRYFDVKENFKAQKHIFFISDDDFDTDDIGNFVHLPEFNEYDELINNSKNSKPKGIKQKIEKKLYFSALLMLLKSDLRQIRSDKLPNILFDKFYPLKEQKEIIYSDLIKPTRVQQLLQVLSGESNIILVYRGKRRLSDSYMKFFSDNGLSVIDLQHELDNNGGNKHFYYHKVTNLMGHWNTRAHHFIGNYLIHEL